MDISEETARKIIEAIEIKTSTSRDLTKLIDNGEPLAVMIPLQAGPDSTWVVMEDVHSVGRDYLYAGKVHRSNTGAFEPLGRKSVILSAAYPGTVHTGEDAQRVLATRYGPGLRFTHA